MRTERVFPIIATIALTRLMFGLIVIIFLSVAIANGENDANPNILTIGKDGNLRSGPSTDDKIVEKVNAGMKVTEISQSGEWHNVKMSDGKTGWIHDTLLDKNLPHAATTAPLAPQAPLPPKTPAVTQPHPANSTPAADRPISARGLKQSPLPAPLLLGAGIMGFGVDNTKDFNRRSEKLGQGWLDPYLPDLLDALHSATGESTPRDHTALAVGLYLPLVEALCEKDTFQPDRIPQLVTTRLNALPHGIVAEWANLLEKAGGDDALRHLGPFSSEAERLEVAGYLVQIDRLFPPAGFATADATTLKFRLAALDPVSVEALSKALETSRKRGVRTRQAAILLIQQDALFAETACCSPLDRERFQTALAGLTP